jgi:hypothetical protein
MKKYFLGNPVAFSDICFGKNNRLQHCDKFMSYVFDNLSQGRKTFWAPRSFITDGITNIQDEFITFLSKNKIDYEIVSHIQRHCINTSRRCEINKKDDVDGPKEIIHYVPGSTTWTMTCNRCIEREIKDILITVTPHSTIFYC